MKRKIALLTGAGGPLGSGHLQRMLGLAWYLNQKQGITAYLVDTGFREQVPVTLHTILRGDFETGTHLIIRDMRDSSIAEMSALAHRAPVLAVDDCGEGSGQADFSFYLLPIPPGMKKNFPSAMRWGNDCFLYGYNFLSSLTVLAGGSLGNELPARTVDIALYAGADMMKRIPLIRKNLPEKTNIAILNHQESGNGTHPAGASSYALLLLSTKIVISHFGILLYKTHLCGCTPLAVNPGPYHSQLAESAAQKLPLVNMGSLDDIDFAELGSLLSSLLVKYGSPSETPALILERALSSSERFYERLTAIM